VTTSTLKKIKAEYHFDLAGAPDVKGPSMRFAIRPELLVAYLWDESVSCVVLRGRSVRRDGTLGAKHSDVYGVYAHFDGHVPDWAEAILADAGLTWPVTR